MKTKLPMIAGLAAFSVFPNLAAAQEAFELGQVTLFTNAEETATDRTGASVVIVTQEELDSSAEANIVDYLGRIPGVTVNKAGSTGQPSGIAVRGASQNYVSVLVDGIDVTDPSGTQVSYDFGQLTTAGVSRIEVLKGSQSALYGSKAVGGVINITTRRATKEGTEHSVAAEYGSFNTAALSYGVAHKSANSELAMTVSHLRTDGISAADAAAGNTETDGFETSRLSLYAHHDFDNGVRIGLSGFVEKSRADYDEGFPLGDGTPDEVVDRKTHGLRVFGAFQTGAVDHEIAVSTYKNIRDYDQNDTFGAAQYRYVGERRALEYKGAVAINESMRLAFGANLTRESYDQSGTFGALAAVTRTVGAYGELSAALGDAVDVTATVRHDDHSIFGGVTTGRVALAYRPGNDWIIRAQIGTGYRAPSNFELYSFYGSTTLQAETSRNIDIGVEKSFGDRATIKATAFWLEVDNLIDYDFAGVGCPAFALFGPGCYNQVAGTSKRKGIEIEGDFALSDAWRLGAAYTYTDSATNASSAWGRIAKHMVNVNLNGEITKDLSAAVSLTHAGDRGALGNYTVVDTTFTYDLGQNAEAYLRIENLFDKQYQLVPGYGTPGRSAYFGIRASF